MLNKVLLEYRPDNVQDEQLGYDLTFPIANALSSQLTWTHYKILVRIEAPDKRAFFMAEATKNAWSVRQYDLCRTWLSFSRAQCFAAVQIGKADAGRRDIEREKIETAGRLGEAKKRLVC